MAGLGGGTGSGMFIDTAYIIREQLRRLGYAEPDVVGLLLLPPTDPAAKKSSALANAFAALTELNHFSSPEVRYRAFFDDSEDPLHDAGAPFGRCIVMPLPKEDRDPTDARHAIAFISDFLCRELISPLGRKTEEARAALSKPDENPEFVCQTFGSRALCHASAGAANSSREFDGFAAGARLGDIGSGCRDTSGCCSVGRSVAGSGPAAGNLDRPVEIFLRAELAAFTRGAISGDLARVFRPNR